MPPTARAGTLSVLVERPHAGLQNQDRQGSVRRTAVHWRELCPEAESGLVMLPYDIAALCPASDGSPTVWKVWNDLRATGKHRPIHGVAVRIRAHSRNARTTQRNSSSAAG
ncbi:hypothetical protein ABZX90_00720 [Streptomyces sp. NPDC002935]|uniref:hypothetical protein n=1 Tax=Streptomyces sp. NPDC002935 TaxID=3154545 RepID=UPI0033ABF19E